MRIDLVKDHDKMMFYIIVGIIHVLIFFSNPFMKVPFDIWEHLSIIRSLFDTGRPFLLFPEQVPSSPDSWHRAWVWVFSTLNINSVFVWAKIIHVTQFILSFWMLYYFSNTVFTLLLSGLSKYKVRIYSVLAVVCWVISTGTYSAGYQQAWIMWYSVGYQITLPMYFYIAGLTISLLYVEQGRLSSCTKLAQIILIFYIMSRFHSMELAYYLIFVALLVMFNLGKFKDLVVRHKIASGVLLITLLAVIVFGVREFSTLRGLYTESSFIDKLANIKDKIYGDTSRFIRFPGSFSEMNILAVVLSLVLIFYRKLFDNKKLLYVVVCSSFVFSLIPLAPYLSSLMALVIRSYTLLWRFYFGAFWFLIVPMCIYVLSKKIKSNSSVFVAGAFAIVLFVILFASYLSYGVINKNVMSVARSLFKTNVSVQYSYEYLDGLNKYIDDFTSKKNLQEKEPLYYVRGDLGPLLRCCFGKYVYQHRKYMFPIKNFNTEAYADKYVLLDVKLPAGSPRDEMIFKYFMLDKVY